MPIPWRLSGLPLESQVDKTHPMNQIKRPKYYWTELFATTLLLPILATLMFVRIAFRMDLAKYFSKYVE